MLCFCLVEFLENFDTSNLKKKEERELRNPPRNSLQGQERDNKEIREVEVNHLSWKVEVKRLVTWPEASGQYSNRQINPWICMRISA